MRIELKDDFCKFRGKGDEKGNPEEESKGIDVSIKVHAFAKLQKRRRGEMRCKAIKFLCHFRDEVARVSPPIR